MDLRWMILALVIGINGCVSVGANTNGPDAKGRELMTLTDFYQHSKRSVNIDEDQARGRMVAVGSSLGYEKPYLPVVVPPKVIKAWVPSHVFADDSQVMVSGHWVFLMLDGTRWGIEGETL